METSKTASTGPLAGLHVWMRLILLAKSGSRGTLADRGGPPHKQNLETDPQGEIDFARPWLSQ